MKKIFLAFAAACMVGMPLVSCDSELDIPKKGNQGSEEEYYKTDEDAKSAIALCYWQWTNLYNGISWTADMLSDDIWCGGGNAGDDPDYHQLNNYNIGTENGRVESDYAGLYTLIYYSNLVIEKVGANENLTPFMKQTIAEAYFFRGFAHFWLAAFWGNPPIVDHLLDPSEYNVSNSADGAAMAQAEKDIQKAIDMNALRTKSGKDDKNNMLYITVEAAKSMLGKVFMFEEKYAEGAKILDEVITSGKYDLYEGEYEDIVKYASNFSCEGVLECNAPSDPTYSVAWTFMTYNFISPGWRNDAIDYSGLDDITYDEDGDKVVTVKPEWANFNRSGYGFCNPQASAYNAFVQADGANGYRTNACIKTVPFVRDVMGLKITSYLHGHDVYFNWKNRFQKDDMIYDNGGWNVVAQTTQRWMRYAEVLLNAAECHFKAGNVGKATEYVNKVRTRAKAATYGTVTFDQIKLERRVELFNEHNRWLDLVRWGDAATVLAKQGQNVPDLDGNWNTYKDESSDPSFGFKAGKNERLPYPNKECLLNPNIHQNPGY